MFTTQVRHGLNEAIDVHVQEEGDKEFNEASAAFGIVKQYKDLGYIIKRKLIEPSSCNTVVNYFLKEVKPYEGGLFRQISTIKEPHKFKHDLMINGFLNTQCLNMFPNFKRSSLNIIGHFWAQRYISHISNHFPTLIESTFWETTLVGTPLHRDGDYVTSAGGILTAMWVALEDIDPNAGRLCLVPRSHRRDYNVWGRAHALFSAYDRESKIPTFDKKQDYKERKRQGAILHQAINMAQLPVIAPMLNKGDAIFWDGNIIHGSLPPTKEGSTRYSIAGHYIPDGDAFIKHGRHIDFEYETFNGMKLRMIPEAAEVDESKGERHRRI